MLFLWQHPREVSTMDNFNRKLSKKIKVMREKLGFSQASLAQALGLGRVAISQIEQGVRKISAEEIAKLSMIFNVPADILLNLDRDIEVILEKNAQQASKREKIGIRISVPQKNLEKFKEVFLYILNKVGSKPNVGESVLYKLLYFIDFNYYEKYEEQLMGATYIKNHYGPTPKEFIKIIEDMEGNEELTKIQDNYFQYPQTKYLPLRKPDLTKISAQEQKVIDDVLNTLSDMNATQISDYSHNDVPWLTAEDGAVMDYESVFYRTPPYSVRDYSGEDIQ